MRDYAPKDELISFLSLVSTISYLTPALKSPTLAPFNSMSVYHRYLVHLIRLHLFSGRLLVSIEPAYSALNIAFSLATYLTSTTLAVELGTPFSDSPTLIVPKLKLKGALSLVSAVSLIL